MSAKTALITGVTGQDGSYFASRSTATVGVKRIGIKLLTIDRFLSAKAVEPVGLPCQFISEGVGKS